MRLTAGLVTLALWTSVAAGEEAAPRPPPPPARVELPVIEVLDPSGVMTAPFVRVAIVKVEADLLACADAWTGDAMAWIVTDWRGKVTKLELAVESAAVQKCFAKALRKIVVAKSQVRATAFVKLTITTAPRAD